MQQYSFGKSVWKGLKAVGILLGVTALTAFTSPDFAEAAKDLPVATVIVPAVQWLAVVGLDWLKHRDR
jgi:hypothetical protein